MEEAEKIALKAACIQAAATLVAALPAAPPALPPAPPPFGGRGAAPTPAPAATAAEPDTGACARYARDLFEKLTGETWDEPG